MTQFEIIESIYNSKKFEKKSDKWKARMFNVLEAMRWLALESDTKTTTITSGNLFLGIVDY